MDKLGRPFKHNVNIDLMKEMQAKGFTSKEICKYFNLPYDTMRWYARKNGIPRFNNDKRSKLENEIIKYLEVEKLTMTETAKRLNTYQSNISALYKRIKLKRKEKEERFQWLKKWEDAKDAEEN